MEEYMDVARRDGNIAKEARLKLEKETGQKVITSLNVKELFRLKDKNNFDE